MIIGVDFDNTIVCYDALFHRVAKERGLIPADLPVNKTAVRDHLRATDREKIWTEMQGEVYGTRMAEAAPYPGAIDFFRACRSQGIPIRIISHKTRHPFLGERHDLHAAARDWLRLQGFFDPAQLGLSDDEVFFELTKEAKLVRVAACGCTHFIDDLPELLTAPQFPTGVERFLFDSEHLHKAIAGVRNISNWVEFSEHLLGEVALVRSASTLAGLSSSATLRPLKGGANNRVFQLGENAVVKRYFQHPGDTRDRFATERAFYNYTSTIDLSCVPKVFGWDQTNRLGVFEFVKGTAPVTAAAPQIEAAMKFLGQLNGQRDRTEARSLPSAAEACLSLDTHLATVRRRIDGVSALPCHDELDAEAVEFVAQILQPLWKTTCDSLRSSYTVSDLRQELPQQDRCISPSDFGFHNALAREDDTLVFFDFEYAGWDDPAKLVSDFFCQPDVPVAPTFFEHVITSVAQSLKLANQEAFAARCRCLLPIYQIKWSCILLNDFTPVGRDRREFSLGPAEAVTRRQRQLARARQILSPHLIAA